MDLVRRRGTRGGTLSRLQDEMNDLFGRFFEGWPLATGEGAWWPALDVADKDDKVIVKAELPGVTNEDIDVSVHGDVLTISGEKKASTEDSGEGYYHAERRYGSFRREVRLPSAVDTEKVEATFRDGVLTITLPKDQQALPKRIEVKK